MANISLNFGFTGWCFSAASLLESRVPLSFDTLSTRLESTPSVDRPSFEMWDLLCDGDPLLFVDYSFPLLEDGESHLLEWWACLSLSMLLGVNTDIDA